MSINCASFAASHCACHYYRTCIGVEDTEFDVVSFGKGSKETHKRRVRIFQALLGKHLGSFVRRQFDRAVPGVNSARQPFYFQVTAEMPYGQAVRPRLATAI